MNKKFDNAYLNQYTDNVIKRGFEICDEWIDKKHNSRKIVASAENAIKLFKKRKTMAALIDALAYIFALDTRIKGKYNNLLRCLLSYFSWRRETRALRSLKNDLNIPLGETDIRNSIAVEIGRLAEKLENDWDEEGDDETHGGKRNQKAEEEAASEEKEIEDAAEKKNEAEELADKEEKENDSEQKDEEPIEETPQKEAKEEIGDKKETAELHQEKAEKAETDGKEELTQEKDENLKEENNVSDDESEPITDKKEKAKAYNDAVDSPPLYEDAVSKSSAEKLSLIDQMIIDNMLKGDKSIMGYQRIDEAEHNKEAGAPRDTVASQNDKNRSTDEDAYLYDKMLANDKGEAQQTDKAESKQEQQKNEVKEQKEPQKIEVKEAKETIQTNVNSQSTEQKFKPLSEMLQADLNESLENQVIKELGNTMSDESREAFAQMQMDVAREKLSIAYAELGIDEQAEIIGMQEPAQVSRQSISPQRK